MNDAVTRVVSSTSVQTSLIKNNNLYASEFRAEEIERIKQQDTKTTWTYGTNYNEVGNLITMKVSFLNLMSNSCCMCPME